MVCYLVVFLDLVFCMIWWWLEIMCCSSEEGLCGPTRDDRGRQYVMLLWVHSSKWFSLFFGLQLDWNRPFYFSNSWQKLSGRPEEGLSGTMFVILLPSMSVLEWKNVCPHVPIMFIWPKNCSVQSSCKLACPLNADLGWPALGLLIYVFFFFCILPISVSLLVHFECEPSIFSLPAATKIMFSEY